MNFISRSILFPALLASLSLAAPVSSFAKDKDRHRNHDHGRHDHDRHRDHGRRNDRDHDRHHHHSSSYRYRSSYPYYSHYSRPYYYGPSIGLSFGTRPSYGYSSSYYRGRSAHRSYADELEVDVQRALARRGYYRGPIDGDIGSGSRAAIRAYQYDRRLPVSGRIESSLLRALDIG